MCCCCGPTKAKGNESIQDPDLDQLEKKFNQFTRPTSTTPDFYPPGKVLHLAKVKSIKGRCFNKEKLFEPFWSSSEDFEQILISSLMWADHMPDFVLDVLKETFQRLSNDTERKAYFATCDQHQHGLRDNGSCYISVLDSPTGAIVDQPGDVDLSFV